VRIPENSCSVDGLIPGMFYQIYRGDGELLYDRVRFLGPAYNENALAFTSGRAGKLNRSFKIPYEMVENGMLTVSLDLSRNMRTRVEKLTHGKKDIKESK